MEPQIFDHPRVVSRRNIHIFPPKTKPKKIIEKLDIVGHLNVLKYFITEEEGISE
jgi:hypothetical protein